MWKFLFIIAVLSTIIQAQALAALGLAVGCRKPAPPKCCPPTCPRCLPVDKRHRPEFRYRSGSLPVSVKRPLNPLSKIKSERKSGSLRTQKKLLDENDFYKIDDWAIPREECVGPNCACANCVCCFTETLVFSTTTTCTATTFSTTFQTSTFTSFFPLTTFISKTNYINFTLTNSVQFISTVSFFATESQAISLTISTIATVTSAIINYLTIATDVGAIRTVFSSFSNGPTVTVTSPAIIQTSSIEVSLFTPRFVHSTASIVGSSTTSVVTFAIFKCKKPVTFSVEDTLTVTPIEFQTAFSTPVFTFTEASATVTGTTTETSTLSKCTGIETIKYTPTRTFLADTIVPEKSPFIEPGCAVCAIVT